MRKPLKKRCLQVFTVIAAVAVMTAAAQAQMIGPGAGMMPGGPMFNNTGGFGMMNGMAAAPVVGDDGTAYVVSHTPTANPGTTPTSNSFESRITAVNVSGQVSAVTIKGIASRPVVFGNVLAATASLPDFSNFTMATNLGTSSPERQSTIYIVPLPLSSSSKPVAASLDGSYASTPVIAQNRVYVVTTDFGNAMMQGNNMFNGMFGNVNFNGTGTAKSYLYIFNLDGSTASRTEIQ